MNSQKRGRGKLHKLPLVQAGSRFIFNLLDAESVNGMEKNIPKDIPTFSPSWGSVHWGLR